jgi:hypothetical protein
VRRENAMRAQRSIAMQFRQTSSKLGYLSKGRLSSELQEKENDVPKDAQLRARQAG